MGSFDDLLGEALASVRARGRWRELRPAALAPGGRIVRNGCELVDFSSNDYLGLSGHPLLAERAGEWARSHGAGAGASRLVTGTNPAHVALEGRIAAFKGTEAALLFASGWQANATVIPALLAAAWEVVSKAHAKDLRVPLKGLENAEKVSLEAKLLKPEDALKSYDGLYTDEYVK